MITQRRGELNKNGDTMEFVEFILGKSKLFVLAIIILVIVYVVFAKHRSHHYPIYILLLLYFILVLLNYLGLVHLNSALVKWILVIGVFLLLSSLFLRAAFPTEKLPIPGGKYQVGTRTYEIEDKARHENYSANKNDKRRLKYQVWYPAQKTQEYKKSKWIVDGLDLTRQLARSMHLPAFVLDHTAEIDSNSYLDAPVDSTLDKYPVVVISHGWKGFRELHTDYAEELASNGFIAVSIDHTYGSQLVKFNDGSLAYLNKKALPRIAKPTKYNRISQLLVTTYGEDVASVLDDLERLNSVDADFKGRLDLDKLGVLGHSTGGAGDVYIALKDRRIKALLGLDAWLKPIESKVKSGLSIPSLFLRSQQWEKGPNNIALYQLINSSDEASLLQLNKTNHVDFSMSYMYSPLTKYIGFTGKLGGRLSSDIQREIVLSFFDHKLRNGTNSSKDYLIEILNKHEYLIRVDTKEH